MSDEENVDFSICRTCLHHYDADSLLSLDELYIMDGELKLLDVLLKFTQMEENENYPQKICGECILSAEAAVAFFKKCDESELILSQSRSSNNDEQMLNINNNSNDEFDESNDQDHKFEIIRLINDNNEENVEIRIILDDTDIKEEYNDDTSQMDSGDEKFIIDYVDSLSKNNQSEMEKCKFCSMTMDIERIEEHKSRLGHYEESESFKCPHCPVVSKNINNFRQHLRSYHSIRKESKKYVCEICSKVFKWSKNYDEHVKNHSIKPEESVMCPECGLILASVTALQIHRNKEHVAILNRTWKCKYCTDVFEQISDMKKHVWDLHGKKDFHCVICGVECSDRRELYYHELFHLDDYGIECEYCHKKLLTEEKLILHQRIHKYVKKKHVCTFCNKGFKQLDKLEAHERIHTGEKPFKCDVCGKAFNHQNNLTHHKRLHTGATPYKCLFCSKAFSSSHSLRKHMNNHEEEVKSDGQLSLYSVQPHI